MTNVVPLSYEISTVEYFARIRPLGQAMLLDSVKPASKRGRFDILVAAPHATISFEQGSLKTTGLTCELPANSDPFAGLQQVFDFAAAQIAPQPITDLPFCGGLVGYMSYDLGRAIETLPSAAIKDDALPDMHFGLYSWAIIVDHLKQKTSFVATDLLAGQEQEKLLGLIAKASVQASQKPFQLLAPFKPDSSQDEYQHALQKIDEYIHAGDCYQVNFAQRFTAHYSGDPWLAYIELRNSAPTPYAAYLETDSGAILSLSPERFLATTSTGEVLTQPIKGTRPRGKTSQEDSQLVQQLLNSEKDRAENVMIVDLLRNDLSKACELNSVNVPELFAIESYKNVHHLVSSVTGKLKQIETPISLLRHCFPGGSITGAPKIRAMEIIDELEHFRRSIYCGSIGYISLCGNMDTSITIRTLLLENQRATCWAGGGIVADSKIDEEFQETFDKVNNLLQTLPVRSID